LLNGAESALDMAEMGLIENGGVEYSDVENSFLRRCFHVGVHWLVS
jgi:hypothetical protein